MIKLKKNRIIYYKQFQRNKNMIMNLNKKKKSNNIKIFTKNINNKQGIKKQTYKQKQKDKFKQKKKYN